MRQRRMYCGTCKIYTTTLAPTPLILLYLLYLYLPQQLGWKTTRKMHTGKHPPTAFTIKQWEHLRENLFKKYPKPATEEEIAIRNIAKLMNIMQVNPFHRLPAAIVTRCCGAWLWPYACCVF